VTLRPGQPEFIHKPFTREALLAGGPAGQALTLITLCGNVWYPHRIAAFPCCPGVPGPSRSLAEVNQLVEAAAALEPAAGG